MDSNLNDWIHDDITWCGCECDNVDCYRHVSNRRIKTGIFTMSYLRNTSLCPLKELEEDNKKLEEIVDQIHLMEETLKKHEDI